ncbi:MAG: hypothetical protein HY827_10770 [Actinobacteria bacterium]|nr:hypothetical protein [Actinomycetota bacterium]
MARAIALGLGEPATFCDSGSGRANKLAELTGGSAVAVEEAGSAAILFLCHKPAQLGEVAARLDGYSGSVVSVLAATPLAALRDAYPAAKVVRVMPNTPVELGSGVVSVATESDEAPEVNELLDRLGDVVAVPESEIELATAIGGCAPAFFALFARRLVDSAEARGMDEATSKRIIGGTLLGTAQLLQRNGMDSDAVMTAVASPGGLTERALKSFESTGLTDSVDRAVATVLGENTADGME